MSKKKLVLINFIIWPVALAIIFFNNYAVRSYYQFKNGNAFVLNDVEYIISDSAFIIGSTDSGNIGLGYYQDNKLTSLYLKSGSLSEIDELKNTFPSDFEVINVRNCMLLLNNANPNLPHLSWAKGELSIYFIITHKPDFDVDFEELCNIVTKQL